VSVVVLGSIGGDVVAVTDAHPSAGETVMGSSVHHFPGGKGANQAVAAARAGAPTVMVGRIGDDHAGRVQLELFESLGIDATAVITDPEAATQTAIIVVDTGGENRIVVVPGASGLVSPRDVATLKVSPGDIVVAQFETPQDAVIAAFRRARERGARTVLNAAPAQPPIEGLLDCTDILVVNETEASVLSGRPLDSGAAPETVAAVARSLQTRPDQVIVITLGARGAVALSEDEIVAVDGHSVEAIDTTGAGDCFVGYLAAALHAGDSLTGALDLANRAGAVCVQTLGAGTSMPLRSEVEAAALTGRLVAP
jgi:ribokinase